ncbi:hypothetical protein [Streptomyces iconiensis]|uniref:WXG100 family type VII secretion target n=1 Tax=Streptomyces iconiensis TaxID=1384038 RepID=A0ABT6ZZN7_9ACTN|nr:hypothetical protein [Streptomyces iconiensis]MDJ1134521.1 hypothetical protein [Streptomyces iconiensis]
MAPGYTHVKNVNLEKLASAVGQWAKLSGKFSAVERTFNTQVTKGLRASGWEGEAADAAFTSFSGIRYQIDSAGTEADSIHRLLSEGLHAFRGAKEQLDTIADAVKGHDHLSLNDHDGSVYVNPDKVETKDLGALRKAYQETIHSYRIRRDEALEAAQKADSVLSEALRFLAEYTLGFNNAAFTSLKDAKEGLARQRRDGPPLSLKDLSDRVVASQTNSVPGSSTLKPAAEFLSLRPLILGSRQITDGNLSKGLNTATGFLPSYAAGLGADAMDKRWKGGPGAGGRHRSPSFINRLGKGGKPLFGWQAAAVATGIDFAYTPALDPEEKTATSRVVAPGAPKQVRWK